MNEHYLYLTLNIGSLSFPLAFSFYPKAPFVREWKYLLPAIISTTLLFVIWDEWFTQLGVWGFNPRYLLGVYLGSLPLEEVLFFLFIPYSCMFIYFSANHLIKKDFLQPYSKSISIVLIIFLLIIGCLHIHQYYTSYTFIALAVFIAAHVWIWKSNYLGKFYRSYLFVIIPFLIVNGILTGSFIEEEVVWYNNQENLNIRLGTIPVDDFAYNMLLLLLVTSLYEGTKRKFTK